MTTNFQKKSKVSDNFQKMVKKDWQLSKKSKPTTNFCKNSKWSGVPGFLPDDGLRMTKPNHSTLVFESLTNGFGHVCLRRRWDYTDGAAFTQHGQTRLHDGLETCRTDSVTRLRLWTQHDNDQRELGLRGDVNGIACSVTVTEKNVCLHRPFWKLVLTSLALTRGRLFLLVRLRVQLETTFWYKKWEYTQSNRKLFTIAEHGDVYDHWRVPQYISMMFLEILNNTCFVSYTFINVAFFHSWKHFVYHYNM